MAGGEGGGGAAAVADVPLLAVRVAAGDGRCLPRGHRLLVWSQLHQRILQVGGCGRQAQGRQWA
jgi:hypothetical protein